MVYIGSALILLMVGGLGACEYTYELPGLDGYRLHQKNSTTTQLLAYDADADAWVSVLPSLYNPAGIATIPDSHGISFVDNDRIKLFYFDRRSAKTIAFCQLLYMVGVVHWIDSSHCYFHAKQHNRFKIFQSTIDGDVCCLAGSEIGDSMYPSIVGSELFYIERTIQAQAPHYCIMSIDYRLARHATAKVDDFDAWIKHTLENPDKDTLPSSDHHQGTMVVDCGDRPIMFLHMISPDEGFFIEHPQEISSMTASLPLTCHWLTRTDQGWSAKPVVSFSVPAALVMPASPRCLFESIVPLLPYCKDRHVYYVDDIMNELGRWSLNLETGEKIFLGPFFL